MIIEGRVPVSVISIRMRKPFTIVDRAHQNQIRDCLFHFVVENDENDITLSFLLDILEESTI